MQTVNFILSDENSWEQLNEDSRRMILGYDDNIMMLKIEFKAGGVGYLHHHIHSQCTYVVSGVFEFQVGDQTKIVKAGDALYMEPNISHGVKCIETGVLIDTFSPMRKDFLK